MFTVRFSIYATNQTSNNIDSNKNNVVTIAKAEGTPSKETEITNGIMSKFYNYCPERSIDVYIN